MTCCCPECLDYRYEQAEEMIEDARRKEMIKTCKHGTTTPISDFDPPCLLCAIEVWKKLAEDMYGQLRVAKYGQGEVGYPTEGALDAMFNKRMKEISRD